MVKYLENKEVYLQFNLQGLDLYVYITLFTNIRKKRREEERKHK